MAYMKSSLISRRIPSGLGAVCSDSSVVWDPAQNACVPPSEVQGVSPQFVPLQPGAAAAPWWQTLLPKPAPPTIINRAGGMSSGAMIAIGLGAVGLLAVLMMSRK